MNNTQLVSALSTEAGISKNSAKLMLEVLDKVIIDALDSGDSVKVGGVTLETFVSPERQGYNLHTMQPMTIPAGRRVRAKVSAELKRRFKN